MENGLPDLDVQNPLWRQLKSFWVCPRTSGTGLLRDLVRPRHRATFSGGAAVVASGIYPTEGAIQIGSDAAYVQSAYGTGNPWPINGNWSCCGWIMPTNLTGYHYLYSLGTPSSNDNINGMAMSGGAVQFSHRYTNGGSTVESNVGWSASNFRWLFVGGVWRAGVSATSFANHTKLTVTTAQTGSASTSGGEVQLLGGYINDPGTYGFPGKIGCWLLFNRALSDAEMWQIMHLTGPFRGPDNGMLRARLNAAALAAVSGAGRLTRRPGINVGIGTGA